MTQRLERTRSQLSETREHPSGELKVTATRGLGGHWLTPRLAEFLDLYPDIKVDLILTDEELDWLNAYHADVLERLSPLITDEEVKAWLVAATRPLERIA